MDIGVIGLGKMGVPMARRLLASGHTVHVFSRSPGPAEALATEGARAASSARDVAERSEVVLAALPVPAASESVFADLTEVARPGQVYVDHSTVSPDLNRRCAERLAAKGAAYLDAPVSGGPAGAEAASLTVMVGGEQAAFDRALPVFQAFGKNIRLCGPVGAGQVVKLVNQYLVGVHTAAIAEATVFGATLGADPQVLLDLIGTSFGGSTMMTRNVPRFISRDFSGATPVRLILKDLGIIHDEAKQAGVPLFLGALAEQRFTEAQARGMGEDDMAGLVRLWEDAAGRTVSEG